MPQAQTWATKPITTSSFSANQSPSAVCTSHISFSFLHISLSLKHHPPPRNGPFLFTSHTRFILSSTKLRLSQLLIVWIYLTLLAKTVSSSLLSVQSLILEQTKAKWGWGLGWWRENWINNDFIFIDEWRERDSKDRGEEKKSWKPRFIEN